MISEDTLNRLMEPIITRQENINNFVIQRIAKRVKEIGELTSSDIYSLTRLRVSGDDVKEINKALLTKKEFVF